MIVNPYVLRKGDRVEIENTKGTTMPCVVGGIKVDASGAWSVDLHRESDNNKVLTLKVRREENGEGEYH